jgi:hypothetical protein
MRHDDIDLTDQAEAIRQDLSQNERCAMESVGIGKDGAPAPAAVQ